MLQECICQPRTSRDGGITSGRGRVYKYRILEILYVKLLPDDSTELQVTVVKSSPDDP